MTLRKTNQIYCGHNIGVLSQMPDEFVDLIYLDPPFFSGKQYDIVWGNGTEMRAYEDAGVYWSQEQVSEHLLTEELARAVNALPSSIPVTDELVAEMKDNLRRELQGRITQGSIYAYKNFMYPILRHLHRVLKKTGSLYIHCDFHANAHLRLMLDNIFGEGNFQNEIIWSYRTGGASQRRWSRKHDTILFYTKSSRYTFNPQKEKAYTKAKGRKAGIVDYGKGTAEFFEDEDGVFNLVVARDVWDIPYINSQAHERLGYPTQKPEAILEKIIVASSNEGDIVLDPFVGGGTACVVAHRLNRKWIGIDISARACAMTVHNFERYGYDIDYSTFDFDYKKEWKAMELMSELGAMTHDKYEKWVRDRLGFSDKKRSDQIGVDGIKYSGRKVAGKPVMTEFLEVKKWQAKVGRAVVSKLIGHMVLHNVKRALIVANHFTRDAKAEAKSALRKQDLQIDLVLIDDVLEPDAQIGLQRWIGE